MSNCPDIDPLITPFVDGEVEDDSRMMVASHLNRCPPCRRYAEVEATTRALLRTRGRGLAAEAPAGLRERCRDVAARSERQAAGTRRAAGRSWWLVTAATVLLVLAGVVGYGVILRPTDVLAAQLTLDHLKCFALFDQPGSLTPAIVQAQLKARYGWDVRLPDAAETPELRLVGGRRCIYLDGTIAHILYKRGRVPVSVFVLPPGVDVTAEVQVMGHEAIMFRRGDRTLVVVSRDSRASAEQVARHFGQGRP